MDMNINVVNVFGVLDGYSPLSSANGNISL